MISYKRTENLDVVPFYFNGSKKETVKISPGKFDLSGLNLIQPMIGF
jgi:hypothetical protein